MRHVWVFCAVAAILLAAPAALAIEGDYNADGVINEADQAILTDALQTRDGDPGFVPAADHDGDGVITLADLGVFVRLMKEANPH